MPEKVIDGVVKIETDDDVFKTDDGKVVDDAQIQALAEKSGDTVEHIKEMLKLNRDGVVAPVVKPDDVVDDDKLLAGKYKTEGDLDQGIQSLIDKYGKEKAYKMLESSMGVDPTKIVAEDDAAKKAAADKAAADALAAGDVLTDDDAAKAAAVAAGKAAADAAAAADSDEALDFDKYAEEFAENEKLSDASYEELAKHGLDKDIVNDYIAGVSARAELYTDKVMDKAGGQEKYEALVQWGTENLTEPEKVRFNAAMNSQDLAQAGLVLDALSARMEKADGSFTRTGVDVKDNVTGAAVVPYASHQEMQTDMRDIRYKNGDPAFHNMVKAKLAVSNI